MSESVIPLKKTQRKSPVNTPIMDLRYFLRSLNADRIIQGVGVMRKGAWVEVPKLIYLEFERVISETRGSGEAPGWEVKTESVKLEVGK